MMAVADLGIAIRHESDSKSFLESCLRYTFLLASVHPLIVTAYRALRVAVV